MRHKPAFSPRAHQPHFMYPRTPVRATLLYIKQLNTFTRAQSHTIGHCPAFTSFVFPKLRLDSENDGFIGSCAEAATAGIETRATGAIGGKGIECEGQRKCECYLLDHKRCTACALFATIDNSWRCCPVFRASVPRSPLFSDPIQSFLSPVPCLMACGLSFSFIH